MAFTFPSLKSNNYNQALLVKSPNVIIVPIVSFQWIIQPQARLVLSKWSIRGAEAVVATNTEVITSTFLVKVATEDPQAKVLHLALQLVILCGILDLTNPSSEFPLIEKEKGT
ncbi:hypothetical protein PS2_015281 [Malus domestica]